MRYCAILAAMQVTLRNAALAAAFIALLATPWPAIRASELADPAERAAVPALSPAGAARSSEGFRLTYDVYKSGFRALSLKFDMTLDGGRYRTDARLESAGIIGWLFEWRLDAVSRGRLQDATVVPQHHRFANSWRGRVRTVEIAYQAGVPTDVQAEPPYGEDVQRAVSADLLPGAVDPMSAVTAIVLENTTGSLCRPTTAVYDGRRRYDAQLTPLGTKILKASNFAPYSGLVEGCHLSFERIAGFKEGDERMKNMSIDIWLADVGTGAGKIPVRLELNTPWGTGFAHLVQARGADDKLVFGDAE
ncbi:MAG: DUF3108 domain-containing protein [Alphaproteobacteria bacterium]|nr:DUF3108 domain-containing protein [Alphaproteobacteria bacterium]